MPRVAAAGSVPPTWTPATEDIAMLRRSLRVLLLLLFVAAGFLLGALNPQPVALDFYGWTLELGLGLLVWMAALVGALLAGAVSIAGRSRRCEAPPAVPSEGGASPRAREDRR